MQFFINTIGKTLELYEINYSGSECNSLDYLAIFIRKNDSIILLTSYILICMAGAGPPYGNRQASCQSAQHEAEATVWVCVCCSVDIHMDACVHREYSVHMHYQVTPLTGLMASWSCVFISLFLSGLPSVLSLLYSMNVSVSPLPLLPPLANPPNSLLTCQADKESVSFHARHQHHGYSAWAVRSSERRTREEDPQAARAGNI